MASVSDPVSSNATTAATAAAASNINASNAATAAAAMVPPTFRYFGFAEVFVRVNTIFQIYCFISCLYYSCSFSSECKSKDKVVFCSVNSPAHVPLLFVCPGFPLACWMSIYPCTFSISHPSLWYLFLSCVFPSRATRNIFSMFLLFYFW